MGERNISEATKQKVLEVAKFIITNKATIQKTADSFKMSVSSIKKYINNLLPTIDEEIYRAVKETQKEIEYFGQITGGFLGKRGPKHSEAEAYQFADVIINQDLTLDQASSKFNIPRSTIHERVRSIDDKELQEDLDNAFRARKGSK